MSEPRPGRERFQHDRGFLTAADAERVIVVRDRLVNPDVVHVPAFEVVLGVVAPAQGLDQHFDGPADLFAEGVGDFFLVIEGAIQ